MSSSVNYRDLSLEDRIRLVQDIWDSIVEDGPPDAVPPWHREILDQRLDELERRPEEIRSWSEVRREIDAEFGR